MAEAAPRPNRATVAWLLHLSDPAGAKAPDLAFPSDCQPLLRLADAHGVLPTVMTRLPAAARAAAAPTWRPTLEGGAAQTLVLRQVGQRLSSAFAAAGLPALVVKGPSFADRLYKAPSWRPFTDLDLLLHRRDLPAAAAVMRQAGFQPEAIALKHDAEDYGEEKWVADVAGLGVLVELHWDMIGSPTLRQGRRVDLALLQAEDGTESPAALLLVAAVHAAYGHAFDRLQPLVDLLQAARGAAGEIDREWLARRISEGGLAPGVALALELAALTFSAPACAILRRDLGLRRPPLWVRRLMTPAVVVAAEGGGHWLQAWRRQGAREWLKRTRG